MQWWQKPIYTAQQRRVEGGNHTPASNRVRIHPSDNLDSIIPVTDVINRLAKLYLSDNAAERLVAEIARLFWRQCHHDTLQQ